MVIRGVAVVALVCLPALAWSGRDGYICEIERAYHLEASGLVADDSVLAGLSMRLFEVDRRSGVITGAQLANAGFDVNVISPGDRRSSFQAYWTVPESGRQTMRWIDIDESVSDPRKPFRAVVERWTYTGYCE